MTFSTPTLLDDISEMLGDSFGAVFATTLDRSVQPDGPGELSLPWDEPIVCRSVGFEGEIGGMIYVTVSAGCARALPCQLTTPVVIRSAAARTLCATVESRRIGFSCADGHVLVDIELDPFGPKLG